MPAPRHDPDEARHRLPQRRRRGGGVPVPLHAGGDLIHTMRGRALVGATLASPSVHRDHPVRIEEGEASLAPTAVFVVQLRQSPSTPTLSPSTGAGGRSGSHAFILPGVPPRCARRDDAVTRRETSTTSRARLTDADDPAM